MTAGILAVPVSAKSFMSSDRRSCASSVLVMSATSRTSRPKPGAVVSTGPPLTDPFASVVEGGDALATDAGGREDNLVTLPAPGAI